MKTVLENNTLTLYLEGKINTDNAAQTEAEIMESIERHPEAVIVLDADTLTYISSSGLRVLMKLRKHIDYPATVKNVSPEIYETFETTGFTKLFDVQKALRSISTETETRSFILCG